MRKFVAFTGVKGSGKSTSFSIIKETHHEVIEVTLADRLKNVSSKVLGIPRNYFDDPKIKEKDLTIPVYLTSESVTSLLKEFEGYDWTFDQHVRPHIGTLLESPRRVAQYVGTEILRAVDGDIHCKEATRYLPENGIFVVTDMRFPNEFGFFEKATDAQFFPLYVSNYAAEANLGDNPHASEKYVLELAKKCERIDNNGTLQELREKVLNKFQDIMGRKA